MRARVLAQDLHRVRGSSAESLAAGGIETDSGKHGVEQGRG